MLERPDDFLLDEYLILHPYLTKHYNTFISYNEDEDEVRMFFKFISYCYNDLLRVRPSQMFETIEHASIDLPYLLFLDSLITLFNHHDEYYTDKSISVKTDIIRGLKNKYLKKIEDDNIEPENEENPKQLSVNQCVLLLEELGVFNNALSTWENTKRANLISLLIGRNEKNIKTAIEKLNKKPSDLGDQYQTDKDIIVRILDSME